jgi:hypothetical protein
VQETPPRANMPTVVTHAANRAPGYELRAHCRLEDLLVPVKHVNKKDPVWISWNRQTRGFVIEQWEFIGTDNAEITNFALYRIFIGRLNCHTSHRASINASRSRLRQSERVRVYESSRTTAGAVGADPSAAANEDLRKAS